MTQMSRLRTFVFTIAIVAIITFTAIAPAAAQEAPGEPANFWGEAVDEDGHNAPIDTTIVAVVDGEVRDEIDVETAGQYGEEDAFGDKLSLDSDAGDTVNFYINDPDGEAALNNPQDLNSGTHELNLEFPAGTFPANDDNGDESSGDDDQSDDSDQDSSSGGSSGSSGGGQPIDSSDDSDENTTSDDSSAVDDSDDSSTVDTPDDSDSSDNSAENEPSDNTETTSEDTRQTDDGTPGFGAPIVIISIVTLSLMISRVTN